MGFNEGIISKSKVVTFLLGLLGSFSQDRDRVNNSSMVEIWEAEFQETLK